MLYARSLLVRQGCHRALPAAKAAAEIRKFRHVKILWQVICLRLRPATRNPKGRNGPNPDRSERPARNHDRR